MADTRYQNPVIKKIITLWNASGPAELKLKYYYGYPKHSIPPTYLPAVFISHTGTEITEFSMGAEIHRMSFIAHVVYSYKREYDRSLESIAGQNPVEEVIEGRNDASDYSMKSTALARILRVNTHLDDNLEIDLGESTKTEYGIGDGIAGPGIATAEGTLEFTVKHIVNKPA